MDTVGLLILVGAYALGFLLLAGTNFNRHGRYRQFPFVVAAAVVALAAVYFYLFHRPAYIALAQQGDAMIGRLAASAGIAFSTGASDFPSALNLFVLVVLALVKATMRGFFALRPRFRRLFSGGRGGTARSSRRRPDTHIGYEFTPDRGIMLKREAIHVRLAALAFAVVLGFLLLAGLATFLTSVPGPLPALPGLPLLLLLEIAFYLGGLRPDALPGSITGRGPGPRESGDFRWLWDKYQTIWAEHWAAANVQVADKGLERKPLEPSTLAGDERGIELLERLRRRGLEFDASWSGILRDIGMGRSVIIESLVQDRLASVLVARLDQTLSDGARIVLLTSRRRQKAWVELASAWLDTAGGGTFASRVGTVEQLLAGTAELDLLVATSGELVDLAGRPGLGPGATNGGDWLSEVRLVLLPDVEESFANPYAWCNALLVLGDRARQAGRAGESSAEPIQTILCCEDRPGIQPALRRNLPLVDPPEHRVQYDPPELVYSLAWREEHVPWYQDVIFGGGRILQSLGAQVPLSVLAWKEEVERIMLRDVDAVPWAEALEELNNARGQLAITFRVSEDALDRLEVMTAPWTVGRSGRCVVLGRDGQFNLPMSLRDASLSAEESALVGVVSPPYILREYFADNLDYFARHPIHAFSPRILGTRLSLAFSLLERLCAGPVEDRRILLLLQEFDPSQTSAEIGVRSLFEQLFRIDVVAQGLLMRETTWTTSDKEILPTRWLRLARELAERPEFEWNAALRIVESKAGEQRELGTVKRHLVYQLALPGQVQTLAGRPYKVTRISTERGTGFVECTHETPSSQPTYRMVRRIHVTRLESSANPEWNDAEETGDCRIEVAIREGVVRIETPGYLEFRRGIDLRPNGHRYQEERVPPRDYDRGRVMRLRISVSGSGGAGDRVAPTLAFLINEMLPTLFPESHQFVVATARVPEGFFGRDQKGIELDRMFPRLVIDDDVAAALGMATASNAISIYFVEDSIIDMGLLPALRDRWREVLMLLDDYLEWMAGPARIAMEPWRTRASRDFLKLGFDAVPEVFDIQGVRDLLRRPGLIDEANALRTLRAEYQSRSTGAAASVGQRLEAQCDFCGVQLPQANYEKLQDGRMRCVDCRRDAIDSLEQLKAVYTTARKFMQEEIEIDLREGIEVNFASAAEIGDAAGERFIPTSGFDPRAVGLARSRTEVGTNPTVLIENGHRHHDTLATVVHELTHVWQFDNLDFEKMKSDYGLDLIEGHAVWAELECMRQLGLSTKACEAQAAREDEYGRGYRTVVGLHRAYGEIGTPFDTLALMYPR